MSPVYIHCPHCGHPVVIAAIELRQTRRCRQCAELFKPLKGAKNRGDGRGCPILCEAKGGGRKANSERRIANSE